MQDISEFINSDFIVSDLKSKNKKEAIIDLVRHVFKKKALAKDSLDMDKVASMIIEREETKSTGIGHGMGFPHIRFDGWGEFVVAIGICRKGIDFDSMDKKPVKFICLMISSEDQPYIILQSMAAMLRFFKENKQIKQQIFNKKFSSAQIAVMFKAPQMNTSDLLTASDIARQVKCCVNIEMPIEEITRAMHLHRLDMLPVVDKDNKFYGEISCQEIFKFGIPDFFNQLNTVSFVRHIDPFSKYFKIKKNLTVKDLFIKDAMSIHQDASLMEILFQMTVQNKSKLFVLDDDRKLIGVIDRFCIIDKILFF